MEHSLSRHALPDPPVEVLYEGFGEEFDAFVRGICSIAVPVEGLRYPHFTFRRTRAAAVPELVQIKEWEAIHGPAEEGEPVRYCASCGTPEDSDDRQPCCTSDNLLDA